MTVRGSGGNGHGKQISLQGTKFQHEDPTKIGGPIHIGDVLGLEAEMLASQSAEFELTLTKRDAFEVEGGIVLGTVGPMVEPIRQRWRPRALTAGACSVTIRLGVQISSFPVEISGDES